VFRRKLKFNAKWDILQNTTPDISLHPLISPPQFSLCIISFTHLPYLVTLHHITYSSDISYRANLSPRAYFGSWKSHANERGKEQLRELFCARDVHHDGSYLIASNSDLRHIRLKHLRAHDNLHKLKTVVADLLQWVWQLSLEGKRIFLVHSFV
jgi:hypothetical protein